MIVGCATGGFPIVVNALPARYPTTGSTRSFWDGPDPGLALPA